MVCIVTLKTINFAIVTQITNALKDTAYKDVKFASTDIVEKITRPSFYIDFQNNKTNLMLANARERNLELRLFYFCKNIKNSKIELMDMQDLLSAIFISHLKIDEETYIHIHECDFDINKKDGYLILKIAELYLLEQLEEEGTEMLEVLEVNTKIN
ncbi:DUF6838 family protein [Clostridium sp. CF012]|uniref:phage tail terminator family protein n=1 Tax=Clostridium sp. CF012 TaxID=2843319 RepID=UPI001C0C1746|nr:hypothetical protein [Clostridium sp. CF012]MBU3145727.1 hypothetical protein [Clostridium sp. CF012]